VNHLRWSWAAILLLLTFLVPRIVHGVRPERRLPLVALDKTVPFENRLEQRSFFWLLDHLKIVKDDGSRYDVDRDYIGTEPAPRAGDPPVRTRDLVDADVERARLLYLIDTYGVYEGDLASGSAMRAALERSRKIYGGLTAEEARAVRRAADNGVTVLAEFNTWASPTGAAARTIMEELLGVRWTHWLGRYFPDLDDEGDVPGWLRRNYEREWSKPWEFRGPGYALVRDDEAVEVLLPGRHVRHPGLTLERSRPVDPLLADAHDGVPYFYWFDVVEPAEKTRVLAQYAWHLKPEGERRLRARGLPVRFPAVTLRANGRSGAAPASCYYLAGDFADNVLGERGVPLAGYLRLRSWLPSTDQSFFWRFYAPMMRELLREHAEPVPRPVENDRVADASVGR